VHTYVPGATSPDGTIAASAETDGTGSSNGNVTLYDGLSQRVLATLRGGQPVQSIGFDETGRLIATGHTDGTVHVWDVASGRLLHTFAAHNGAVGGVAFSPTSDLLATAGEDATAKLWNLATGKRLLTLRGHSATVTALAFNPGGTRLATGGADGTVRVYVLPIEELMTISRARLTRGWTAAECARYLRGGRCPADA
jgi:WD40 repeat protein